MPIDKFVGDSKNTQEISLRDFILTIIKFYRFVLSNFIIITVFVILGAICAGGYAYIKKPVYTATTTFVLESNDSGSSLSQYSGLASMVGINLGGGGGGIFQGDNIMELYKSRKMLEQTLLTPIIINSKKQTLMNYYIGFNNLHKNWKDQPQLLQLNFDSTYESYNKPDSISHKRLRDSVLKIAINDINKNSLSVSKPDKKLSIIKVEFQSTNEQFSKLFNEALVKNVNEFYIQTKTKKSLDNVSILQKKVDSVKSVMNGAIYSAAAVMDATPNLNFTKLLQRNVPAQKAQFTAEANRAIMTNLVQSLELGKISLLKETPLIQTVDVPVYPLEKSKLGKLKSCVIGGTIAGIITTIILLIKAFIRKIKV